MPGAPVSIPRAFIMASNRARCSGLMFFIRSLASGIFCPFTSRSLCTCQSPGLMGGAVCACTTHAPAIITKPVITEQTLARSMALFLDRADETPKGNDERLTAAWSTSCSLDGGEQRQTLYQTHRNP